MIRRPLLVTMALMLAAPAWARAAPDSIPPGTRPTLDRVVIIERHGVRSPTKPAATYARYASDPWPDWPVAPGELTPHGAAAIRIMGGALRAHFAALGLLPATGCPQGGTTLFWSDNADSRTVQSGKAVAEGFAPGCDVGAGRVPGTATPDPLFHQDDTPSAADEAAIGKAFAANLATIETDPAGDYGKAMAALHAILTPGADLAGCGTEKADARACALVGTNAVKMKHGQASLSGPLFDAASLTENLLLEYAQGFPAGRVGWGRAGTAARIAAVMPLHRLAYDVRHTPVYARDKAGLLMQQIIDILQVGPPMKARGVMPVPAATRFALFLGHDTNIANLAGLLGLDWTLPGQPDRTAPDTAMAFERWSYPGTNRHFIRIEIFYQTLDELRALTPLTGGSLHSVRIAYPDCAPDPRTPCQAQVFDRLARRAVDGNGVPPEAR